MTQFRPGGFQVLPLVIKNLLIINGLVFLAQTVLEQQGMGGELMNLFALHHVQSPLFSPYQLITHLFMHGDIGHIFFNMFALWMFGSILENLWGPKRFLIFYLACGLGAAVIHLGTIWIGFHQFLDGYALFKQNPSPEVFAQLYQDHLKGTGLGITARDVYDNWMNNPQMGYARSAEAMTILEAYKQYTDYEPTIGASGAVFGCLAAFGYLFPNSYIYLYFFVPIKVKWFVLGYAAVELFMGLRNSAGDNVAHWAHLGGALVGFLLVFFWNKTNRRTFY